MKFLSTASLIIAASIASAAVVPDSTGVKEPESICVEGTLTLIDTIDVDGQPLTIHGCTPKDEANPAGRRDDGLTSLTKRNKNLCQAPCTTHCNKGSGGPNPNDCTTMAKTIANHGKFTIPAQPSNPGPANWAFQLKYLSCEVQMFNELPPGQPIDYCYDWDSFAGVIQYVAWNCQGTAGDNGGTCKFYNSDGVARIDVKHS